MKVKNVRATGYLISPHIDNDGLEITSWPQNINLIKGQLEVDWSRLLEFPFTKFNIPSQQESISLLFSPQTVIFDLISSLYVAFVNTTLSRQKTTTFE